MFHFSVRVFGRCYSLQHADMWAGRDLVWFWSYRDTPESVRYHCGSWVLYVARSDSGRRVDLELGRFALSF